MASIHALPKTFHSPIQSSKPKRLPPRSLVWIAFLAGGLVLAWYFFYSSQFAVREVKITGSDAAAVQSYGRELIGKNIFLVNETSVTNGIAKVFPSVARVTIARGLPHTIRLTVELREPKLRWQSGSTETILDEVGYSFDVKNGQTGGYESLPLVVDTTGLSIKVGQFIVSPGFVDFVSALSKEVPQRLGKPVARFEVAETTLLVDTIIDSDTRVKFALQRDVTAQLSDANLLLTQHPEAKLIDVRVDGWGYWK